MSKLLLVVAFFFAVASNTESKTSGFDQWNLSSPQASEDSGVSKGGSSINLAVLCFKTGEQKSGMNKICYYDCLGSTVAITISSVELCPLSINR